MEAELCISQQAMLFGGFGRESPALSQF